MGIGSNLVLVAVLGFSAYLVLAVATDPRPLGSPVGTPLPAARAVSAPPPPNNSAQAATSANPALSPQTRRLLQTIENAELVDLTTLTNRWRTSVAVLGFKLKSRASYDLMDIAIACVFSGKSGTRLNDITRTAYRILPAGKTLTVEELNFGFVHPEASNVSCRVKWAERDDRLG